MNRDTFRCCLIGETSLLIQCVEILGRRGHTVCAVVSQEDAIREWAKQSEVPLLAPGPGLAEALAREPFDYIALRGAENQTGSSGSYTSCAKGTTPTCNA